MIGTFPTQRAPPTFLQWTKDGRSRSSSLALALTATLQPLGGVRRGRWHGEQIAVALVLASFPRQTVFQLITIPVEPMAGLVMALPLLGTLLLFAASVVASRPS